MGWRDPSALPISTESCLDPFRQTYRLTALPPYRLTALPPYRLTALPPDRPTARPPDRYPSSTSLIFRASAITVNGLAMKGSSPSLESRSGRDSPA